MIVGGKGLVDQKDVAHTWPSEEFDLFRLDVGLDDVDGLLDDEPHAESGYATIARDPSGPRDFSRPFRRDRRNKPGFRS
jgi:hypothetical protein